MPESGLPHLVHGSFELVDRDDVPPIRMRMVVEGDRYVARLWTDDGKRDTVARAPDASPESLAALDAAITKLATEWLEEDAEQCPTPPE